MVSVTEDEPLSTVAEAIVSLNKQGLRAILTRGKRATASWSEYQSAPVPDAKIATMAKEAATSPAAQVAILTGVDGLYVVDFDDGETLDKFLADAEGHAVLERLTQGYVERTPSGGCHAFFRVRGLVQGNTKLAQRPARVDVSTGEILEHNKTLIETRGGGGYVVTYPSPGYVVHCGSLDTVPEFSEDDAEFILEYLRMFGETPHDAATNPDRGAVPAATPYTGDELRPGEDLDRQASNRGWWRTRLTADGWERDRSSGETDNYRRPGKTSGTPSATVNWDGRGRLRVFSSNAGIKPGMYSPFAYVAMCDHGGDFAAAAAALAAQGYGTQRQDGGNRDRIRFGNSGQKLSQAENGVIQPEIVSAQTYSEYVWAETNTEANEMVSAQTLSPIGGQKQTNLRPLFRTAEQIMSALVESVYWIVFGIIAKDSITEITGKVKQAGKTTFLMSMVKAILEGGPFIGQTCIQMPVIYLTEQNDITFKAALIRAGINGHPDLHVMSWHDARAHKLTWEDQCNAVAAYARKVGAGVVIVDTLGKWAGLAGDGENSAGDAGAAMDPLKMLSAAGHLAVVSVRHSRKSGGDVGDDGRGSSAFAGDADILLSLRRPEGNHADRPNVRELQGIGRLDGIPEKVLIELQEHEYVLLGTDSAITYQRTRDDVFDALPEAESESTSMDNVVRVSGASRTTVQRVVDRYVESGHIGKSGTGRRGAPCRYWRIHWPDKDIPAQGIITIAGKPIRTISDLEQAA